MSGPDDDINEREEEISAFDGGVDEKPEGGSSLPMVIVISLVVLAAFSSVVWVAYNNGVIHSRANMQVADIETNEKPATPPGSGDLTPPQAQTKAFQQPAPSEELPVPPSAAKLQPVQPVTPQQPVSPPAKPAAVNVKPVPPAKQVAEPKQLATAPKPTSVKMTETVKPAPEVRKAAPLPASKAATVAKKAVSPAAAIPAKSTKVAAAATAAGGQYLLQIGAYKSQADAEAAWTALHKKHAGLLAGLGSDIVKVDLGDKGTWYRLRVTSFADKNTALTLCGKLKAEGGNCFVTK
jgi:outer membrane biosynthesis protein TonB